jgi:hypothetical protein
MEQERIDKPTNNEKAWFKPRSYKDPEMRKIQLLMENKCLDYVITPYDDFGRDIRPKVTFERAAFDSLTSAFFIDTLERRLFIKSNSFFSQPTSLEDRITHTRSIDRYNFQMQLLISESIRETSRGQREYIRDSSQTFYTYFDFGLLQHKQEYHYQTFPFGGIVHSNQTNQPAKKEPTLILEENVVIKHYD